MVSLIGTEMFFKKLSGSLGISSSQPVARPPEETDMQARPDRIGRYFRKYLDQFVFLEFSPAYMEKAGMTELMKDVPIPLRKQDLEEFKGGEGLKATHLAKNMAIVMGCDPHFEYTSKYVAFLSKLFNYKIYEGMLKEGRDSAEKGDFDDAAIHFRAALCMNPAYMHAMYSYARVCREIYMGSRSEEKTGRFKAESLDYFELLTEYHPRFAQGFYYLGYAYLNLGLYIKAELAWKDFLAKSHNGKDRREIRERLKQLDSPIQIEKGCNEVLAGRYEKGIEILEPFLKTQFKTWWPMSYYLGVAYRAAGRQKEAVTSFKRVLTINGSHLETMEELAGIYGADGDRENQMKYRKKIDLIRKNAEEEEKERKESKKRRRKQTLIRREKPERPEDPEPEKP